MTKHWPCCLQDVKGCKLKLDNAKCGLESRRRDVEMAMLDRLMHTVTVTLTVTTTVAVTLQVKDTVILLQEANRKTFRMALDADSHFKEVVYRLEEDKDGKGPGHVSSMLGFKGEPYLYITK